MGSIVSVGQQNQAPHIVIAGIVAVAFTALLIDRLIVRIERRFSAWKLG
jgi:ABC-type nitrate/sulfonate/bicarbonate transport system permease component